MMIFRSISIASISAAYLIFGTPDALAATTHLKWNKSTTKNRAFVVAEHWDAFPDCSTRSRPRQKVVVAPKHGKARAGQGKITLKKRDPYFKCSPIVVSGSKLTYTPEAGFSGKDYLKLQVSFSTGDVYVIDIAITVK